MYCDVEPVRFGPGSLVVTCGVGLDMVPHCQCSAVPNRSRRKQKAAYGVSQNSFSANHSCRQQQPSTPAVPVSNCQATPQLLLLPLKTAPNMLKKHGRHQQVHGKCGGLHLSWL
jgi:hypothetical protein